MGQYLAAIEKQDHRGKLSQWIWWRSLVVVLGISLVKISVGLFLLRFTAQKKWLKWFIIGSVGFLVCFTIASLCTLIFQCVPIQAAWESELRAKESTKCFTLPVFLGIGRFNACKFQTPASPSCLVLVNVLIQWIAINIITDFLYATLPVFMFYNVQVNKRSKISLMGILGLGYL